MAKVGDRSDITFGAHLGRLRTAAGLTLRQVEEATEKEVSNAYLSQLDNNKIAKPSPNILHALARVYGASYEELMTRAGYLAADENPQARRRARVATYAIEGLTSDEEAALLAYLAFVRQQKRK
jgi:transcriptional regulator with XRE-family HTH domain